MRARSFLHGAALLISACALAAPAIAEDHDRGHDRDRDHDGRDWHDRDIRRFHEHDIDVWRGGRWEHGRHEGREGWWWIVNGGWYWYPAPAYPYPDPYLPPVAAPPLPPTVYYWCDNPRGYYPYVPQCLAPWRAVPAR